MKMAAESRTMKTSPTAKMTYIQTVTATVRTKLCYVLLVDRQLTMTDV